MNISHKGSPAYYATHYISQYKGGETSPFEYCQFVERHMGRPAGKRPSTAQGLVLSSDVIPWAVGHDPVLWASLTLLPAIHSSYSSKPCFSIESELHGEGLGSRENNPVPSRSTSSVKIISPFLVPNTWLGFHHPCHKSLQHFGLKALPPRPCCNPHTGQISGVKKRPWERRVTPVPESLQHGTRQDRHSLSGHVSPGSQAGVSRMCVMLFSTR